MNIDIGGCLMHFLTVFWVVGFCSYGYFFLAAVVALLYLLILRGASK